MNRKSFHHMLAAAALALGTLPLSAVAQTEISFFYPVAVGGPITKLIDDYAADFEQGEPRHQGQADLRRQLPGHHRQGAHRAQERARRR